MTTEEYTKRICDLVKLQWNEPSHNFSWALDMLKNGHKVARGSWEKKFDDFHLELMAILNDEKKPTPKSDDPLIMEVRRGEPYIWEVTQYDILADDWYLVQ